MNAVVNIALLSSGAWLSCWLAGVDPRIALGMTFGAVGMALAQAFDRWIDRL